MGLSIGISIETKNENKKASDEYYSHLISDEANDQEIRHYLLNEIKAENIEAYLK